MHYRRKWTRRHPRIFHINPNTQMSDTDNKKDVLPESVKEFYGKSNGVLFYGKPIDDLSKESLLALIMWLRDREEKRRKGGWAI